MLSHDEIRSEPKIELPTAQLMLDQKRLTGWVVIDKEVTPLAGPVRVKVLSRHLKAVDLTQGESQDILRHENLARYEEICKLSEAKRGAVAQGPEYVVELSDHDHKQVRLWLHSETMKCNLVLVLTVGSTVILGHKKLQMPMKVQRMGYPGAFLVPNGWQTLDSD